MKTITKVALSTMTLVAVAAGSVAGTLAYLKAETPTAVNAQTVGNVKIEQIEQQRVDDDANQNKLEAYVPFAALNPCYYEGSSIPWAPEDEWVIPSNQAWKVVEDTEGVIDKFVSVKNTGENAAYVRTIIALEVGKDGVNDPYCHVVHNTTNIQQGATWELKWLTEATKPVQIGDAYYALGVYTYTEALPAGETTIPSLKQIYLDKTATNEVMEAYGDTFNILVMTQAVQAQMNGLTPEEALNEAFTEITTANHPWSDTVYVSNTDELNAAIEAGAEDIVLNAGNYGVIDVTVNRTLNIFAAAGADVNIAGIDGQSNNNSTNITIKGVTLDNSLQTEGWFIGTAQNIKPCVGVWGGNYTFEDCTFNVTGNSGAETGVMSWWTTNHGVMNFTNCTFNGENASARGMQIYGNYDLNVTGCTFNTAKDYSIKYVGDEDCVATFENNTVNATTNFVQTGSAPYAGADYSLVFVNNNLADGIKHVYVDNAEGQTIIIDGETKEATAGAIY